MNAGNVAVGLSAFLLLGVGPRLLSPTEFVQVSLAWTLSAVFGFGIALPAEQLLTRRVSAGDGWASPRGGWLSLAAVAAVVLALALGRWSGNTLAAASASVGVIGWTVAAQARGRLAGQRHFRRYSVVLLAESLVRVLIVILAAVTPGAGMVLMGSAVGVPILVAGALGLLLSGPPAHRNASQAKRHGAALEPLAFVTVAIGYQLALNTAPLLAAGRADSASALAAGAFILTNSILRAPAVLNAGFATHTLANLSRVQSARDPSASVTLRRDALGALASVSVATVAALAVLPLAMPALFGSDPGLPAALYAGLAVSTVVASVAAVLTAAALALKMEWRAMIAWTVGASLVAALTTLASTLGPWLGVALVVGPIVTLLLLLPVTWHRDPTPSVTASMEPERS